MHEVLANRLGGLSLPRKSVIRLTDRPDMTIDVYRGSKTTTTHTQSTPRAEVHLKLPRSKGKFSGSRKLTLRYQLFEISIVEMERKTGTTSNYILLYIRIL